MSDKKVSCDCGKIIHGQTDDELVAAVQAHAKHVHNMSLTSDQVLAMAEPS